MTDTTGTVVTVIVTSDIDVIQFVVNCAAISCVYSSTATQTRARREFQGFQCS